jgi:hypothetical protein
LNKSFVIWQNADCDVGATMLECSYIIRDDAGATMAKTPTSYETMLESLLGGRAHLSIVLHHSDSSGVSTSIATTKSWQSTIVVSVGRQGKDAFGTHVSSDEVRQDVAPVLGFTSAIAQLEAPDVSAAYTS